MAWVINARLSEFINIVTTSNKHAANLNLKIRKTSNERLEKKKKIEKNTIIADYITAMHFHCSVGKTADKSNRTHSHSTRQILHVIPKKSDFGNLLT